MIALIQKFQHRWNGYSSVEVRITLFLEEHFFFLHFLGYGEEGSGGLSADCIACSLCENSLGCKPVICALSSYLLNQLKLYKKKVEIHHPIFAHTHTHTHPLIKRLSRGCKTGWKWLNKEHKLMFSNCKSLWKNDNCKLRNIPVFNIQLLHYALV